MIKGKNIQLFILLLIILIFSLITISERLIAEDELNESQDSKLTEEQQYAFYCSQCHALYSPKAKSANEWVKIVQRMDILMKEEDNWGKWQQIKLMSDEVKKGILSYLEKNALKSIDPDTIKNKQEIGSQKYRDFCSRCHDLPDPKQFTKDKWPIVVSRMRKYMQKEGIIMSSDDEELILTFLQDNATD
ncbi:MAG: hypothetical protein OEV44_10535 [Spirochaetota bacterium]|nr:hypothetical protein [Spirochaetota bacterium]